MKVGDAAHARQASCKPAGALCLHRRWRQGDSCRARARARARALLLLCALLLLLLLLGRFCFFSSDLSCMHLRVCLGSHIGTSSVVESIEKAVHLHDSALMSELDTSRCTLMFRHFVGHRIVDIVVL